MVSGGNGYGVREQQLWCQRVTVMVLESDGCGVREQRSLCERG
jgi:hypothetical protein